MSQSMKKTKKSTSKARQSARASVARSNRIKAIFIVAAFILVGVGVIAVQKAKVYKASALASNCRYDMTTPEYDVICDGHHMSINTYRYLKHQAGTNAVGNVPNTSNTPRTYGGLTAHQWRLLGASIYAGGGSSRTSASPSTGSQSGGSTSGSNVASSGHSVAGLVIPTPVPHCTPIRTAPVLTSPSGHLTSNGAVSVSPGSHPIKWTVAAGQKGGVVVIDDKSNPASSSCNHLNNGDACRVPESKGRTNTVSYNFKRGKKYNIRVTTINCGTASTASRQLKVEVANPSATPIPSTPGISTTPTP